MAKKNAAQDHLKAKAAKQKKIAIGGFVLLLALVAIQGPRTMKMLNPPAPAAEATAPAATPGAVPLVPPTLSAPAVDTAGGAAPSTDSDPAPPAAQGQLVAFGRFASKDPFRVQVSARAGPPRTSSDNTTPSGSTPSASTSTPASGSKAATAPASEPTLPGNVNASPTSDPAPVSGSTPTPTGGTSKAMISINGKEEEVAAKAKFPAVDPVFVLVSLKPKSAKIAIAGGSFASGGGTVTLTLGKPLTLMNTADGTRYELRLVSTT